MSNSTFLTPGRKSLILQEWRTLALLGGPVLVAQLAQIGNGVIDTVMAGHASAQDLAGVGIGTSIWIPLQLFCVGILNALQPTISGLRGAGRTSEIAPLAWQGIYIGAVAAVLMVLLLCNVRPLLDLLHADPEVTRIAEGYLRAFAWGVPAVMLINALRGLTDGLGHTRVIMVFFVLSALLNIPLNYLFIYGKFGLPALGGIGCGWATSLANGMAALALVVYLNRSPLFARFHLLSHWRPPIWREIRPLLRLGLPIGFTMFVEVTMFAAIALFLAPLGAAVVAGHQIVLNLTSVLFMVPLSLGMALTLRVSFLLGAGKPAEARLLACSALALASAIALIYVPLLLVGRDWLPTLYSGDAAVQAVTSRLLIFAAIFQWADCLQVTAINALRGYRDTRVPMLIVLLSFWAIGLPLGYALTFTDWLGEPRGAEGFWLGLILGLALAGALLTLRLLRTSRDIRLPRSV